MKKRILRIGRFASLLMVLTVLASGVEGQSITDGSTPSGIAPGSPAGSYSLSGFDNVNLFNGNLDVRLKVLTIGGRGGAGMTVAVGVNPEPWVVKGTGVSHDWWSGLKPGYGPGVLQGRRIGLKFDGPGQACSQDNLNHYRWTRTTLTFTASDGTEFELWDKLSGGPWIDAGTNYCSTGSSRGTEFVTADGTYARFISDSVITDRNRYYTNTEQFIFPSGYLVLRDGTRYRIVNGLVYWMRDRNGNLLSFTYGLNSQDTVTYRKVLTITDSLNRVVSFQYSANYDVISFKGSGGAPRTITVNRNLLSTALRADFASLGVKKPSELFPGITPPVNEQVYNPSVTTSITLPDGRSYQFAYNQYAEVGRVVMPTGGAVEYDMAEGSGLEYDPSNAEAFQILRRVSKRRIYVNQSDTTPAESMTYTAESGNVRVDHLDPQNGNSLLAREKHYFHGDPVASLFVQQPYTPPYNEGREYQTEFLSVLNGVAGDALRKVVSQWEPGVPITTTGPSCNARVKETTTTLLDTNQVSKQTFGYYDSVPFNNQNNVKEYDFGSGAPGTLLRETRTTYVTSSTYTDTGVSLLSLPSQVSVWEGGVTEIARTTFEYDTYNTDTYHSGLTYRSNISGLDAAFTTSYTTRGNVTGTTNYFLTNGSVTGSISSYAQYDVAGNIVKAIDPRSTPSNVIATTIDFADRFGSPDGEARNNSGATELAGQMSYAFPTLVTNALGQTVYTQFDYYLGRAVDAEDANGTVSSSYFNDALDRPKQVIRGSNLGTGLKSQSTIDYDDTNRVITTTSDQATYGDNALKSQVLYDGMGRTTEKRQYESANAFIAVRQTYDALGRSYRTSSPFRSGNPAWTTTTYDSLSRVKSVETPDLATVKTDYSGNRVLVADQNANDVDRRKRISETDALGRLKTVWEIRSQDSGSTEAVTFPNWPDVAHGYRTNYAYDTLDDERHARHADPYLRLRFAQAFDERDKSGKRHGELSIRQ